MSRIARQPYSAKLPQQNRTAEHEEYWQEHKGITKCPVCGNVHFKKRWFASEDELKRSLNVRKLSVAEKKLCPACHMIKDHLFEGELLIEGFPDRHRVELLHLVQNFGDRALAIDPQHRIIQIEENAGVYRVTTTENQLVDRIAKKIKDVFNKVEVHISHSAEPSEVDRVRVRFKNNGAA